MYELSERFCLKSEELGELLKRREEARNKRLPYSEWQALNRRIEALRQRDEQLRQFWCSDKRDEALALLRKLGEPIEGPKPLTLHLPNGDQKITCTPYFIGEPDENVKAFTLTVYGGDRQNCRALGAALAVLEISKVSVVVSPVMGVAFARQGKSPVLVAMPISKEPPSLGAMTVYTVIKNDSGIRLVPFTKKFAESKWKMAAVKAIYPIALVEAIADADRWITDGYIHELFISKYGDFWPYEKREWKAAMNAELESLFVDEGEEEKEVVAENDPFTF